MSLILVFCLLVFPGVVFVLCSDCCSVCSDALFVCYDVLFYSDVSVYSDTF